MNPIPSIEVVKTARVIDTDNDNINDTGDVIVYTITVNNTGNLLLTNVSIADTLRDGNGNLLSLSSGPTLLLPLQIRIHKFFK